MDSLIRSESLRLRWRLVWSALFLLAVFDGLYGKQPDPFQATICAIVVGVIWLGAILRLLARPVIRIDPVHLSLYRHTPLGRVFTHRIRLDRLEAVTLLDADDGVGLLVGSDEREYAANYGLPMETMVWLRRAILHEIAARP